MSPTSPMTPERLTVLNAVDRSRLVEVWEAAVRATHHFLGEEDIQFFKPLVRDVYLDAVRLVCLRGAGGSIVGFIGTAEGKVEMLFVDPAHHGQGFGRALLRHVLDEGGITAVDVNEQNPQAVGFYQHLGFAVEGRSERDGQGKPFPLLHLHWTGTA
ncbi:GNAT family N-acetyltransferase [Stigmatella hybrida]|uniref:GNAT family N-acetyltransferase n=1 Tax=Stigmatella hybrida TaxID=394097 RepID=UPI001CDAE7ED|nr:GNAT family N-acetyltransferase [Stigmatella hybrida]